MTNGSTHATAHDGGHAGARPYVPAQPTIPIDSGQLAERFEKFEQGARKIRWDSGGPVQVDWTIFDPGKLVAYLELVGLDKNELHESLQRPRSKKFDVPYIKTPLQANCFTYCQELLTAFFYQMFRRTVQEPLLNELLTKIIADEWRHFHWYEGVVKQHLATDRKSTLEEAMPVFENFAMPGNQILGSEYEILTDQIIKQMRFSTGEIFAIGRHVTSTFGLIEGGRLIARSSYARDMKDVVMRKKPPKPRHDEVVRAFKVDIQKALTAGTA